MYTATLSTSVSYLTANEAAERLGVSVSMIYHYIQRGLLAAHTEDVWGQWNFRISPKTKWLIPEHDFLAFEKDYRRLRQIFHKPGKPTRKEVRT